jgi:hypothetical protein
MNEIIGTGLQQPDDENKWTDLITTAKQTAHIENNLDSLPKEQLIQFVRYIQQQAIIQRSTNQLSEEHG